MRLRYVPAILWAALLFFLSSLPSTKIPDFGIAYEDLFLHFLAYSVFGVFLSLAASDADWQIRLRRVIFAALIGILYGASDEFHQSFVPGRFPAVSDFCADSLGILFGCFVFVKWSAKRRWLSSPKKRT